MDTANFANQMLAIGGASTFDATKLSNSTLRSTVSHIKTLRRNGIPITEEALTLNTVYMLDRLVDANGRLLTDQYKRQIGSTIKRLFPTSEISLYPYNKTRQRNAQTRVASEKYVQDVRKIRDGAVDLIVDVNARQRIDDLGMYDTCLAILITISTSLRIHEILQLKLAHIPKIQASEPIGIKSKSSNNVRYIAPNDLLINVFATIQRQRGLVQANIQFKKTESAVRFQQKRLNDGYMIISSEDYMRKKLHELAASLGISSITLGFNVFRKHITSVLTAVGGHFVAQALNNHSSVNTTLDHYNVVTSQSAQATFDDLIGKFDSLDKPDTQQSSQPKIIMDGNNKFVLATDTRIPSKLPRTQPTDGPATSPKRSLLTPLPDIQTMPASDKLEVKSNESIAQKLERQRATHIASNISDINNIHSMYTKRLNDLQSMHMNSTNKAHSLQYRMQNTNDITSLNTEIAKLLKILTSEKQLAAKLNIELNNRILATQLPMEELERSALINYKKTLDGLVRTNIENKKPFYTAMIRHRQRINPIVRKPLVKSALSIDDVDNVGRRGAIVQKSQNRPNVIPQIIQPIGIQITPPTPPPTPAISLNQQVSQITNDLQVPMTTVPLPPQSPLINQLRTGEYPFETPPYSNNDVEMKNIFND